MARVSHCSRCLSVTQAIWIERYSNSSRTMSPLCQYAALSLKKSAFALARSRKPAGGSPLSATEANWQFVRSAAFGYPLRPVVTSLNSPATDDLARSIGPCATKPSQHPKSPSILDRPGRRATSAGGVAPAAGVGVPSSELLRETLPFTGAALAHTSPAPLKP